MKAKRFFVAFIICSLMVYALFFYPYSISRTLQGEVLLPEKAGFNLPISATIHLDGYYKGIKPLAKLFTGTITINITENSKVTNCQLNVKMQKIGTVFSKHLAYSGYCIRLADSEWDIADMYVNSNFDSLCVLAHPNDGNRSWTSKDCLQIFTHTGEDDH